MPDETASPELEEEFERRQEDQAPPAPEPEPEPEPEGQPEPATPEPDSEAESARRLYEYFQANPDMQVALVDLDRQRRGLDPVYEQPEPTPEPESQVPDFWAAPDKVVGELYERVARQEQFIADQQHQSTFSAIQMGQGAFAQAHPELSPADLTTIGNALSQKNVMRSYWERNPGIAAVVEAYEDTYKTLYFDRSRDVVAQDIAKGQKEKRRAASVGVSQRSSPRIEPVPQDRRERREAMVRDLAEQMEANR